MRSAGRIDLGPERPNELHTATVFTNEQMLTDDPGNGRRELSRGMARERVDVDVLGRWMSRSRIALRVGPGLET